MADSNHLQNIAIVGAAGNIGTPITSALLAIGTHNITALTRHDSTSTFPPNIAIKKINYDDPATITAALRGQDALVITLSGYANIQDVEAKLVKAAAEADVKWILPNEWSPDTANEGLVREVSFLFQAKVETRKLIEQLGQSAYTAMVTGHWYEYSLAKAPSWGFDFGKRSVTFFDEGETKVSTSTCAHVGRAVAAFLSLPIKAESGKGPCLQDYRNKVAYTNSFTVSQKDMLASACRVTETKESDWTISREDVKKRVAAGQKEVAEKNFAGMGKIMYTRVFYPGDGDFESSKGTINGVLDLPKEDLDEATRVAVERQKAAAGGH